MSSKFDTQPADFESVKTRLAEIADAVDDESLSLDEALDLYEEAVAIGLAASDLLETGIVVPEEEVPAADEAADQAQASGDSSAADVPDSAKSETNQA
ncbi:MAG: exodeoxyribonuclease VII small subunit [Eggerthellaceae bacterium]|nr:exodeoxyribonuclease VII small subunit [Eggerthellaceae bacterium]